MTPACTGLAAVFYFLSAHVDATILPASMKVLRNTLDPYTFGEVGGASLVNATHYPKARMSGPNLVLSFHSLRIK